MKKNKPLFLFILFVFLLGFIAETRGVFAQEGIEASEDFLFQKQESQATRIYAFPLVMYRSKPGQIPPDPVGPVGGTFTAVLTDPDDRNIVYGGHFQRGIFKSYNQGQTWYEKNVGLPTLKIQSLAIHPNHSNILYAGTYGMGVYLSRDAGQTWIPWNGGKLNNHIVYDIEIDRVNPSNVYVASRVSGDMVGYLFRSTDAGENWNIVYRGDWFNTPDYFYDVAVHPAGINIVFLAAHEHGILRSLDNGVTFNPVNNGVTDLSARGFAFTKANQNIVLASMWKGSGVFRSTNLGNTWQQSRNGLPNEVRITKIKGDPYSLNTNRFFVSTFGNGVYNSGNFGDRWDYRGLNGYEINDVAVSYHEPQTWFLASQDRGMLRTKDGGTSWATVNGDLRLYTITGMETLQENRDFTYVSVYGQGIFKVQSNPEKWFALNNGLEDLSVTGLYSDGKTLWATNDSGLWSLRGERWSQIVLPKTNSGIEKVLEWQNDRLGIPVETLSENIGYKGSLLNNNGNARSNTVNAMAFEGQQVFVGSDDGVWQWNGEVWEPSGLQGQFIQIIETGPSENTFWAYACDADEICKIWRKDGQTWKPLSNGLEETKVNALKIVDGSVFAGTDQGISCWDENQETWLSKYLVQNGVLFLDLQADEPGMIVASGRGVVLLSKDKGETWQQFFTGNDWAYPYVHLMPGKNVKFLLGSKESGAFIMAIEE